MVRFIESCWTNGGYNHRRDNRHDNRTDITTVIILRSDTDNRNNITSICNMKEAKAQWHEAGLEPTSPSKGHAETNSTYAATTTL